jgi:hypothetical protein
MDRASQTGLGPAQRFGSRPRGSVGVTVDTDKGRKGLRVMIPKTIQMLYGFNVTNVDDNHHIFRMLCMHLWIYYFFLIYPG